MSDLRFRFGPLETRGLLLGLRAGQLTLLVAGTGVAVVAMAAMPLAIGALVGVTSATAATAAAFVGARGRGIDEWVPVVVRCLARALAGRNRVLATAHHDGYAWSGRAIQAVPSRRRGNSPWAGLRVMSAPQAVRGHDVGVIADTRAGTSTAVIALDGGGFALLSDHEKERRLAWWAGALDSFCREGSNVHRLQWVEHSIAGATPRMPGGTDMVGDPVVNSYAELLTTTAPSMQDHRVLLAVQVRWSRSARAIRAADRSDRVRGASIVVAREVEGLLLRLGAGGAQTARALDAEECAATLRAHLGIDQPLAAPRTRDTAELCARAATLCRWDRLLVNAVQHATYWIREWPRIDVGPDFLGPVLLQTVATRTVAVTMAFEPPRRAQRQADAALTADLADDDMRRRTGFISGFRRAREREDAARRGEEIAEGHGAVRFSGYITVSAGVDASLDAACADVELRAQQSHLDLQRLYGQQDDAVMYTLPLARGLR